MRGKKDPTVQAAIALHLALRAMVLSAEWRSVQINTDQSQKLAQGDGATFPDRARPVRDITATFTDPNWSSD